jgi:hypothetical protein
MHEVRGPQYRAEHEEQEEQDRPISGGEHDCINDAGRSGIDVFDAHGSMTSAFTGMRTMPEARATRQAAGSAGADKKRR